MITIEKVKEFESRYKKGTFFKVFFRNEENGYVKETHMVGRLVRYESIKSKPAPKDPSKKRANYYVPVEGVPHVYHHTKTNLDYIQVALTKVKSRSKCFKDGEEISVGEYLKATKKPAPNGVLPPVIKIKLINIVELG